MFKIICQHFYKLDYKCVSRPAKCPASRNKKAFLRNEPPLLVQMLASKSQYSPIISHPKPYHTFLK